MTILALGMSTLVLTIFLVMGTPFIYYTKRDQKWQQSDKKSLDLWYE